MEQLHDIQRIILRTLLFTPDASYTELQKACGLESDRFKFHLSRLVELGLVEKISNKYRLTIKGKEFANRLDTNNNQIEKQAKISVIIAGWRQRAGSDQLEFLVQQRLKNPYFGYWARIGGKVRWGETILEAAARELKEETGLSADLEYRSLYHKMDYREDNHQLLEDKYFLLIKATNFKGNLVEEIEGGKNAWLTADEINQQPKVFQGMRETFEYCNGDTLSYHEHKLFYKPEDY